MKDGDHWLLPTTQACQHCQSNAWPCVVKIRRRSDHFACLMCRKGKCSHKDLRAVEMTGPILDVDDRRKMIYQTLGDGEAIIMPPPNGDVLSLWSPDAYGFGPDHRGASVEEHDTGDLARREENERSRAVNPRDREDEARNAPTWRTRSSSPRREHREYRDERHERPNPEHHAHRHDHSHQQHNGERYERRERMHRDDHYDPRQQQVRPHHLQPRHDQPQHLHPQQLHPQQLRPHPLDPRQLQQPHRPRPDTRYETYPGMVPPGPSNFHHPGTTVGEHGPLGPHPRDHVGPLPSLAELAINRLGLRAPTRTPWDRLEAARLVGFYPPNSTDPRLYANNPRLSAAQRAGLSVVPSPSFAHVPFPGFSLDREDPPVREAPRRRSGELPAPHQLYPGPMDARHEYGRREYDPRDPRYQYERDERRYSQAAAEPNRRPVQPLGGDQTARAPIATGSTSSAAAGPSMNNAVAATEADDSTRHEHTADGYSYPPLVPLPRAGYVSTTDAQKARDEGVDK
ncbi:uncharacterized protein LOC62_03G005156 [Vanrija pseudolonga]|uniref:Uncharacterized protein n=1 Tax=Vanrija pseudolonga TaxID=143232 RepID=A0AAF0Y7H7_9TREE|nr:hypothetical protein LOC62_03G005156 [Vanrija pseudolonga]